MTTQSKDEEESEVKETRKIIFRRKYRGEPNLLDRMRTLTRFCHRPWHAMTVRGRYRKQGEAQYAGER